MTEPSTKKPVQEIPMAIHTPFCTVAVYGHQHVTKRDIELLALVLNSLDKDAGVRSVIFRTDNRPKGHTMNCCPNTMSIAVNLDKLVGEALEYTIEHPEHSAFGKLHFDILFTFFHEIAHLYPRVLEDLDDVSADAEEDAANQWAKEQLIVLAKSHNVEPALFADCPYVMHRVSEIMHEMLEDSSTEDQKWGQDQLHKLDNRIFYELLPGELDGQKHNGLTLHNFKSYVALAMGQDMDDPEWNKPVDDTPTLAQAVSDAIPSGPAEKPAETQAEPAGSTFVAEPPNNMIYADYDTGHDIPWDGPDEYEEPVCADYTGGGPDIASTNGPVYTDRRGDNLFQSQQFNQQTGGNFQPMDGGQPQPQERPHRQVHPQTGLNPQQTGELVMGVYRKIYNHVFSMCQWQTNNDIGFLRPEAVAEVPIQLTPDEARVVVKCDCLDLNGRWTPQMPTGDGQLRGYIASQTKLPMYKLWINNNGEELCRLLIPQNPAKRNAQGYTKTALQARGGSAIMYILEGNDAVAQTTGKKWMYKIVDHNITKC